MIIRRIDPALKEWLEVLLDFLTSAGTLAAVFTAIALAKRERKDVLRGRASERFILFNLPRPDDEIAVVHLEVTNLSPRPVAIRGIGWTCGMFSKRHFFQIPDFEDRLSSRIPITLEYGGSAQYNLPLKEFLEKNAAAISAKLPVRVTWFAARLIYFTVTTSGYPDLFEFRVDPGLGRSIVKQARRTKKRKQP